jgi:hypothetical protein
MDAAILYFFTGLVLFVFAYWKEIRGSPTLRNDLVLFFWCLFFIFAWPGYIVAAFDGMLEKY